MTWNWKYQNPYQVFKIASCKKLSYFYRMKFQFWTVGKAHESYVKEGVDLFTKRICNYYTADWHIIPMPKNAATLSETDLKKKEGKIITGAYGVSEAVKQRANYQWSLSKLVFPHQLVRLILAEQIYRACSINRNEKYHHS